jgi:uncharacterized membrane protein
MNNLKQLWSKISNTKSLLAIVSLLLILTDTLGYKVDNQQIMQGVKAVLGILVILGVINNTGMETTKFNK